MVACFAITRCKGSAIAVLAPPIQRVRGAVAFLLLCFGVFISSVVIKDRGPLVEVLSTSDSSEICFGRAAVGRCEGVYPFSFRPAFCAWRCFMGGLLGVVVARRIRAPTVGDGLLVGTIIVLPSLCVEGWWGFLRSYPRGCACGVTVAGGGFQWQHSFRRA